MKYFKYITEKYHDEEKTLYWSIIDNWIPNGSNIDIEDPKSSKHFTVKRTWGIHHADVEPLTSKDYSIIRSLFPQPDNFKDAQFHQVNVHIKGRVIPAALMTYPHAGAKGNIGHVIPSNKLSGYTNNPINKKDIYSNNQLANRNYIQNNNANGHMCLYFKGSLNHLTNKPEPKVKPLLEFQSWNSSAEYNKAADRIKDYYLKHLDELKEEKKSHFLQRLQVCYGPHWQKEIYKLNEWIVDETWELWNEYKDGDFGRAEENKLKSKGDATGVYSKEKNLFPGVKDKSTKWAKAHLPEFAWEQGFGDVQNDYSILVRLGMLKNLKNKEDIKKWLQDGWMERWEWLIDNPTVIISHPVHTVNYLYHGLECDFIRGDEFVKAEDQLIKMIEREYEGKLDDDVMFNNYIYAWTHMIIGASGYYVRFLPEYKERYRKIIDILTNHKKRIFNISDDLTAEVGLIYVICRIPYEVDVYRNEMLKRINKKIGIVLSDGAAGDPDLLEHTNIITILLLNGLHYLRDYLNEKHKYDYTGQLNKPNMDNNWVGALGHTFNHKEEAKDKAAADKILKSLGLSWDKETEDRNGWIHYRKKVSWTNYQVGIEPKTSEPYTGKMVIAAYNPHEKILWTEPTDMMKDYTKDPHIDEKLTQKIPDILYHATYKALLPLIKKEGLDTRKAGLAWEDSKPGIVYLANDPDVAESYAEAAEEVSDKIYDSGIVILKIATKGLDIKKLHDDRNVRGIKSDTYEYHGEIPWSKINESLDYWETNGYIITMPK